MTDLDSQWTGAYATPKLVGRDAVVTRLLGALAEAGTQPQVLFILGDGGIGKTRVLNALLDRHAAMPEVVIAQPLIDLYDTVYHGAISLTRAIVDRLPFGTQRFRNYEQEYRQLIAQETTGALNDLGTQRKETLEDFVADLVTYAADRRVLIAFDTAERLIYIPGNEHGVRIEIAEAWHWLTAVFHRCAHVSLIVAGRSETEALAELFASREQIDIQVERLDTLTEAESETYFDFAAEAADLAGKHRVAEGLRTLALDYRRQVYRATGGRPILLALLADLSVARGVEAVKATLAAAPAKTGSDGGVILDSGLEAALIRRLIETPSLGMVLLQMGRLPRGAEERLLSQLLSERGYSAEESTRQIGELRQLSFVKVRDQRYFLHDELYAMLERGIYSKPTDGADAGRALKTIVAYLETRHSDLLREQDEIFAPVEVDRRSDRLDHERLADILLRRRALVPELVYYQLRQNPTRGFRHYYRHTFEAVISGDSTLDVQLEAAILNFLRDRDPDRQLDIIGGLERELVVALALIRPVARHFADGNYTEAITEAERLRADQPELLNAAGPATRAVLDVWESYARTYRSHDNDHTIALSLLNAAITTVRTILERNDTVGVLTPARRWRTTGTLALAYQVRGYLHRVTGYPKAAADDYTAAIPYWRELRVNVNLATTLNDLGFARAEQGYTDDARALVLEALEIRRSLGARVVVGFSLNTLALVDIYSEKYSQAVERSEQALSLFRALRHERGIILALIARAEATRRSSSTTYSMSSNDQAQLLQRAARDAREARDLAQKELERRVRALIEIGCATRDLVRLRERAPQLRENWQRLADESRSALDAAAALAAQIGLSYRVVDARVNKAHLEYYLGDLTVAAEAAEAALNSFPEGYIVDRATGKSLIDARESHGQIWSQLGKLYVLYGLIAFQRYLQANDPLSKDKLLAEVVDYFFFSLECNLRYSPAYPGLTQSRNQIHGSLKLLPADALQKLESLIAGVEQRLGREQSELRRMLRSRALL